jgi:hypothetical protein
VSKEEESTENLVNKVNTFNVISEQLENLLNQNCGYVIIGHI